MADPSSDDDDLLLANQKEFCAWLGLFYVIWSALEIELCYAIGRILELPHHETHLLTTRMEFGRKAALFSALLKTKGHPNRPAILSALAKVQKSSKRNVFAHSFLSSDRDTTTFVERNYEGKFIVRTHQFTLKTFIAHVQEFKTSARELASALQINDSDFQSFCAAAESAKKSE